VVPIIAVFSQENDRCATALKTVDSQCPGMAEECPQPADTHQMGIFP